MIDCTYRREIGDETQCTLFHYYLTDPDFECRQCIESGNREMEIRHNQEVQHGLR